MDATLRIIEELDIVCLLLSKSYLTNVGVKLQINLSYKKNTQSNRSHDTPL